jgi:hypothetical protein
LLQPAVISATAARPTTAAWRYSNVLMSFLSRLAVVCVELLLMAARSS